MRKFFPIRSGLGLVMLALLLSGCGNPYVQNQKQAIQDKQAIQENKEKSSAARAEVWKKAGKYYDKSAAHTAFGSSFAGMDFASKYTLQTLNNQKLKDSLLKNDESIKDLATKNIDNTNMYIWNITKQKVTNNDRVEIMDDVNLLVDRLTKHKDSNSNMNNIGSYVNKADQIDENPHYSFSDKRKNWNRLQTNITYIKSLIYEGQNNVDEIDGTSDDLEYNFSFTDFGYIPLVSNYQKDAGTVAALDVLNSSYLLLNSENDYIQSLKNGTNSSEIKEAVVRAQAKLANSYTEVQKSLQIQVDNIKKAKQMDKNEAYNANKWNKSHNKNS
ncbi:hypothetical protein EFL77_09040 [Pediococcus pentosaceus]|uniref:hypothetical protein n=1 Tax=Pediococcus pentosaceus TaxID=1255 RepID=UPI00223C2D8B|nr:hypothetical protein [Pediococcus pentosaceus]MCT1178640.1 hypothetical protein [Pediococcus pentosaceus]